MKTSIHMASIAVSALVLGLASSAALAAPASYHLVDLGPRNYAGGSNQRGDVAGMITLDGPLVAGYAGADGVWHPEPARDHSSEGLGINLQLDVVGYDRNAHGKHLPVLWHNGQERFLNLPYASRFGDAEAINNDGVVVGTGTSDTSQHACFRWQDGVAVDLGNLGLSCSAHAINASGQIAGESDSPHFNVRAVIIDQDGMHNLGLMPGGYYSKALGINAKGHAAVFGTVKGGAHAALWNGHRLVDLGSLDDRYSHSIASAINDHDELAGLSTCGNGLENCLFLYADGQMTPVQPLIDNAAGWVWGADDWPVGITNDGVIIGNATGPDFSVHGYRLVPNAQ